MKDKADEITQEDSVKTIKVWRVEWRNGNVM